MTKQQYASEAEALAPSLRRIALSIVHSEHDAQDAVQQALLSVWERREHVDAARLRPYLTRAVICNMKSELDEQVRLTVTIPRSDAAGPRVLRAEREFERCRVEADVTVTELVIRTEVTVTSLTGEPVNGDGIRGGDLSYYTLYLNGQPAEGLGGESSGFGTGVYTEIDEYMRPETMPRELTLVPAYWNEEATDREEHWEEAIIVDAT